MFLDGLWDSSRNDWVQPMSIKRQSVMVKPLVNSDLLCYFVLDDLSGLLCLRGFRELLVEKCFFFLGYLMLGLSPDDQ